MDNKKLIGHKIIEEFVLSSAQADSIVRDFRAAMEAGLAGMPSPLKMLPTYTELPEGTEQGCFIALDFGGTNLRVMLIELSAKGNMVVKKKRMVPLHTGSHKLFSPQATAVELFDFIVEQIAALGLPKAEFPLGFTFSFPCLQNSMDHAVLISWTKEIQTSGVEGQDVLALLKMALSRSGLHGIVPKAVINDTVGSLLTAAYHDAHTNIASICGTGHNTCYLEPVSPLTGNPMIINMESGNFDRLPFTSYDDLVDQHSERPGEQRLEKMVAGRYIGEIFRYTLLKLIDNGIIDLPQHDSWLLMQNAVTSACLSEMLSDGPEESLSGVKTWLNKHGVNQVPQETMALLRELASVISKRSARLAASTFMAVLLHIDPDLQQSHAIAVDGSLYEKMPGYKEELANAIKHLAGSAANRISIRLVKDGSGFGAAIAAASVGREKENRPAF